MMYGIGEVSKMFALPVSTLRYYDNEGLFPNLQRNAGVRVFGEQELEQLRVIECLKRSGLEIKDIKRFMELCKEGSKTFKDRKEIFEQQKLEVEKEIEKLKKTHDMLQYKCWYYQTAIADGSEKRINEMLPDRLPDDIQKMYNHAHES
ncbi:MULTISPECIES: MerR family transcriptional regulator [unclassified Breznakia]|uniref:MerR family transcriptional regulator n=1 Tax=unclassified Breznakia TaxID=2623764 RepID=UPI002475732D|nr:MULTISPECIES: MerR family transcriptional regulator [unclassified Breznakia]MDH6367795.1 DNA-binding transcriptional MerR regulator [Breznakia sp. PH1-1]MDH6404851.1 DNA-binding transcriptional MerR regulator [Breznakia sp. PF1-11]MDH6412566.1 DNA-binding transcriptional MerR regulator [Breznakia sp. PFB1-11]MDH6414958.1 DNA-binding transcriptional MerR regulator [Breznakia sp. PFB1-14]MDH6417269.1 DNA-binding transcriptional MerR regulator [Breznakia sp. PFB1-4]